MSSRAPSPHRGQERHEKKKVLTYIYTRARAWMRVPPDFLTDRQTDRQTDRWTGPPARGLHCCHVRTTATVLFLIGRRAYACLDCTQTAETRDREPPRGTTQRALGLFCRCGAVAGFEAGCRSCGLEETSGSRAPAGLFDVVGRFAGQGGMEGEVCACCLRASNLVASAG